MTLVLTAAVVMLVSEVEFELARPFLFKRAFALVTNITMVTAMVIIMAARRAGSCFFILYHLILVDIVILQTENDKIMKKGKLFQIISVM